MKSTLILLVLALFYLCHVTNAYNAELCDDNPTLSGIAREFSIKWHYLKVINQCSSFLWGGVGYTSNFFTSKDMCREHCLS